MDGDALIGISTEREVMKCIARGLDVDTTPVTAIMTRGVQKVTPYTSVNEAARTMASRWIRYLPVTEDGLVVGMVSQRALIGIFATLVKEPDSTRSSWPATSWSWSGGWPASSRATSTSGC